MVIDLGEQLNLHRSSILFQSPNFMDYRLYVLNDEIYLHANADTVVVSKISVKAKGFGNSDDGQDVQSLSERDVGRMDRPYKLKAIFGSDNLQVTLMHMPNTIWSGGEYIC